MTELSLFRLYALRAMYLLIAVGMGVQIWPDIVSVAPGLDWRAGVIRSFLGALTLLCLVGVRYPVKMLPLLVFEFLWKAIWVFAFWLRLWYGQPATPAIDETFFACLMGVILVPLVLPWGHLYRQYVLAPGDRWRPAR